MMLMKNKMLVAGALSVALMTTAAADQDDMSRLDHVFVIVMENHAYGQIVNNPYAPFTNWFAGRANTADNYFAIGHPSLTNYLELVGGSNFGVLTDNSPDWHNPSCIPNIVSHITATDVPASPDVCPIAGAERPRVHARRTSRTAQAPWAVTLDDAASSRS